MNTTIRASRVAVGDTVILCGTELTVADGFWPPAMGPNAYPFPVVFICTDATGTVSRWNCQPDSTVTVVKA